MSFRRSKVPKFIPILSLLILLVLGPIVFSFLQNAGGVEAAWVDDNFSYRNAIPITSHTAAENNVYVSATIDTSASGQFQADCGDLRFTTVGGDILPYYIVSGCVSASTVVHVFFKSMPAGAQTIYYYYGNPSASNGFSSADFATVASSYALGSIASQEKGGAPVAYWKFDEGTGTTTKDSSSNKLTSTIYPASVSWMTEDQCIAGKCLFVNDVGSTMQSISTADNSVLDGMSALSVGFWVKSVESKTRQQIIYKRQSNGSPAWQSYQLFLDNNLKPNFIVTNGSGTSATAVTANALELNKWYYIVGTYDGAQVNIFVDGKPSVTSPPALTGSVLNSDTVLLIGGLDTPDTYYLHGFVDDVKIYNYARTAAQIKSDFKSRGTAKGVSVVAGSSRQNSDALSNGLVGYWKMDEVSGAGSTLADSSGNSNTGTAVLWGGGNTSTDSAHVAGKFGNSFSFDGGDDNVTVTDVASLQAGATMTVSTWFKLNATASDKRFVDKTNNGTGYSLAANTTTPRFITGNGSTYDNLDGTTTLATGTWYHMVGTVENGTKRIYVNGNLENTASITFNGVGTGVNLRIGARAASQAVNASIDEIRLYNRALSPREVRDLYNWAPGPVGHWMLDEGSGNANDASGNGFTGTNTGTSFVDGKYGKARSFNGSSDFITVSDMSSKLTINTATPPTFTLGAWFKPTAGGNDLSGIRLSSSISGARLFYRPATLQFCMQMKTSTGSVICTGASSIVEGNWYHVEAVYDSVTTYISIYLNGVLKSSGAATDFNLSAGNNIPHIGTAQNYFKGSIDDVRIYNYARTQKQIVEDMNADHPVGGSPVGSQVGYWKMDEGYGTTTNDSGPNNIIGTLLNTPGWSNNGKFGKAIDLPGTNQWVRVNDNSALDMTGPFTISAWINRRGSYSNQEFISKVTYGTNQREYELAIGTSNALRVGFTTDGTAGTWKTCTGTTVIPQNQWTHVLGLYDGTYLRVYINGKPDTPCNIGSFTVFSGTSNLSIGQHGTDGASYFNGILDEIKIYSSALTEDEIKLDYNRGQAMVLGTLSDTSGLTGGSVASSAASALYCLPGDTATCSPPVGEWNFEEGTTGTSYDSSGNGNNGTDTGTTMVDGKIGKARNFNGSSDLSTITDNSLLRFGTGDFTVESWVKFPISGSSNWEGIVTKGYTTAAPANTWGLIRNSTFSNGIAFQDTTDGGGSWNGDMRITSISDGWHHFAALRSGTSYKMYMDGILTVSQTKALVNLSTTANIKIGSDASPRYFQGSVDGVKIFNYARTPAQIALDYNQGKPIAQWKMDECQGGSIFDASGNGNTGTITIGATGTQTAVGTCTTSGTAWYNGVTGKFNSSLNFDGTDDYVNVGDPSSGILDVTGTFTISAWIKFPDSTNNQTIYSKTEGTTSGSYWFVKRRSGLDNKLTFQSFPSSSNVMGNVVPANTWQHVAVTYNSAGNVVIYQDGVQTNSAAAPDTVVANSINVNIGQRASNDQRAAGQIDDVRIFNYALTATQVKNLFNGGAAVKFAPVTGSP